MKYAYPAVLAPQRGGGFTVTFPDVPEAITEGDNRTESLEAAADALVAALGAYVEKRRPAPAPSRMRKGQELVVLSPLISAKLGLWQSMREARMTRVALAGRLGVSEAIVRRLLDLDHRSHIEHVEAALAALGKRLVVEIQDAA
jgi:antitoxin HicB